MRRGLELHLMTTKVALWMDGEFFFSTLNYKPEPGGGGLELVQLFLLSSPSSLKLITQRHIVVRVSIAPPF